MIVKTPVMPWEHWRPIIVSHFKRHSIQGNVRQFSGSPKCLMCGQSHNGEHLDWNAISSIVASEFSRMNMTRTMRTFDTLREWTDQFCFGFELLIGQAFQAVILSSKITNCSSIPTWSSNRCQNPRLNNLVQLASLTKIRNFPLHGPKGDLSPNNLKNRIRGLHSRAEQKKVREFWGTAQYLYKKTGSSSQLLTSCPARHGLQQREETILEGNKWKERENLKWNVKQNSTSNKQDLTKTHEPQSLVKPTALGRQCLIKSKALAKPYKNQAMQPHSPVKIPSFNLTDFLSKRITFKKLYGNIRQWSASLIFQSKNQVNLTEFWVKESLSKNFTGMSGNDQPHSPVKIPS